MSMRIGQEVQALLRQRNGPLTYAFLPKCGSFTRALYRVVGGLRAAQAPALVATKRRWRCMRTHASQPAIHLLPSQQQAGEGPSPAAEERSSARDDAAPTEQSALASSSPASSVGYGQGAAKPRRAGESTAARRWSGDLGTCDAH